MQSTDYSDSLVPVSHLPLPFQPIFNFRYFNSVQSESFREAYLSDDNMVVSAPTGSGKTGLFELCVLRLMTKYLTPEGQFSHVRGALKIVYVAPMKALIQEKCREWNVKFGQVLGLVCRELTGDSDILNMKEIQETDLILTTPEKFDSITRRYRDQGGAGFFGDIALFLIDEVHLLNDSRGAALEAIVSRIKMLARYPELQGCPISNIRMVSVSATIPNIEDLAQWLRVPPQSIKRFGEEMRPVKLTTRVFGYAAAKNDFMFEKRLQNFLYDIILQHNRGKPALVFCSTRKGAQDAAMLLSQSVSKPGCCNPFIKSQEQFERLQVAASRASDKNMQFCIKCGVGYHNGGLDLADRGLMEALFLSSDLQVLCTTMTLAHGVNLPAHLVVIKSTQYFNKEKGRYLEYERSTLLQMCGRAGRPQFDDSGVVVLMTRNETTHLYENLLSGSEPVESELLPSLAEHLNAEIVLMTVSDVGLAIDWLKCSYLYVRMRKNPNHYGIDKVISEEQMEKHLKGICLKTLNELAKYGMVLMDEYGFTLKPHEPGRLMAKYYLNFETMKTITDIPERSTAQGLLHALAKAQELSWIQLRRHEKKLLNAINQETGERLRFRVLGPNGKTKKRIQTADEKIFILANDALSGEPSQLDFTMTQDVTGICTNGTRIARCMSDYFKFMKRFTETKSALLLAKCLRQKLWEDSPYQLKQLPGIGMVTAKAFRAAGVTTFDKLASADPRHLEFITGRKFPYGDQVKGSLVSLPPKVDLRVEETGLHIGNKSEYCLELTRLSEAQASNKWHMADLIVGDELGNELLFHEKISPYVISLYSTSIVVAALISEQFAGVDNLGKMTNSSDTGTVMISNKLNTTEARKRKSTDSQMAASAGVHLIQPKLKLSCLQSGEFQRLDEKYMPYPTCTTFYCKALDQARTSKSQRGKAPTRLDITTQNRIFSSGTDRETDREHVSKVPTPLNCPMSLNTPSGKDLKSLQSFLLDPEFHQSMFMGEGDEKQLDEITFLDHALSDHTQDRRPNRQHESSVDLICTRTEATAQDVDYGASRQSVHRENTGAQAPEFLHNNSDEPAPAARARHVDGPLGHALSPARKKILADEPSVVGGTCEYMPINIRVPTNTPPSKPFLKKSSYSHVGLGVIAEEYNVYEDRCISHHSLVDDVEAIGQDCERGTEFSLLQMPPAPVGESRAAPYPPCDEMKSDSLGSTSLFSFLFD